MSKLHSSWGFPPTNLREIMEHPSSEAESEEDASTRTIAQAPGSPFPRNRESAKQTNMREEFENDEKGMLGLQLFKDVARGVLERPEWREESVEAALRRNDLSTSGTE